MVQQHEQDIVDRIIAGDMRAFELLVNNFKERVINICFSYTNNLTDAEDISQEVFIELFKSLKKFKGDAALSTWIFKIASNKSLDHIRKQNRIKRGAGLTTYMEDLKNNDWADGNKAVADSKLIDKQRKEWLYYGLSKLPKRQNEAFVLTQIEGMDQQAVSQIMGTSVKSIEALVARGRKKLKSVLAKQIKEYL
ncbi:RNA polymerase sigma-70 factor, ECF subfamily [Saccharicrinis carchari]|uniref:RNA polymerase sigma-70 factor, ECF subfamily n=1 Tax=Saccharicrinis carchari TaxID=1168039 RepID=A0A521E1T4_SACCC|nr:RNA polymerase sigma factor [Saccharicrinis carchari]SMO77937.1 RNA polymerase sigma-70 factor, ECF subfamily [Saccharicrinis carchari]